MCDRQARNTKRAKFCNGCAWLHIGVDVSHNHCDYANEGDRQNKLDERANHKTNYMSTDGRKTFQLEEYLTPSTCRWFWDEKLDPNPSHAGFYYGAPPRDNCPEIPKVVTQDELDALYAGMGFRRLSSR